MDPHDLWDYDEINENVLVDLDINNQHAQGADPPRPQRLHVRDRPRRRARCSRPIPTTPSPPSNRSISRPGGRSSTRASRRSLGKTVEDVCPASPGAKDWQPTAWSPRTKLLYVPHQHLCMNFQTSEVGYIAGTPYVGATVDMYAGPGGYRGEFMAWDPVKRTKVWSIAEKFPVWSGALVTAGDVAFYGTMDRWFKAVDAKTGKELWKFHAGSGFIGQPVTFMGNDGVQYVAILSGVGGWSGAVAAAEIDPRVRNGALGFHRRDAGSAGATPSAATACWCLRSASRRAPRPPAPQTQGGRSPEQRAHDAGRRQDCRARVVRRSRSSRRSFLRARQRRGAVRQCRRYLSCLRRSQQPAVLQSRGAGFENKLAEFIAEKLGKRVRLYLVGAAARLHPQHAQGGRLRRRDGRARQARHGGDHAALLPLDLCLRIEIGPPLCAAFDQGRRG